MFFFINVFFLILFILFTKFFFKLRNNFSYKIVLIIYVFFSFLLLLFSIKFNYLNYNNQPFNFLCLIMNIMIFISYILTIGAKYVNSPSYYIIKYLKNHNPCQKQNILANLKTHNMIEIRIDILQKEKLIKIDNDFIYLTDSGKIFCKTFIYIKNFFGLNSEG